MTPAERRNRISSIFELAVKLGPEEQARFLERECLGQETLLEEIRSLLSKYRESVIRPDDSESSSERAVPSRIGRYQIKDRIGHGGFGQVYSALDSTVGRAVAVKVLSAPDDPNLSKRFRAEATTAANLHHKNIVTVHDFGEENGVPYIVMELLEGTTIRDLIRQQTPLALDEKLWIMSEVAEGLDYAHRHEVIHRDVKPANIMRLADGSVKIMDFGIARLAREGSTRLTHTGLVVGTLMYMAPEQFSGIASPAGDIFAFGLTFYEFLSGQHPFYSEDATVIMYRIVNDEPAPLRTLVPDCPEAIERIVSRTLAKSRHLRYSSLADVVSDLRPVLMDLRRQHAGELFTKAEWLLGTEQIDAAQSAVRRALELDPWHPEARHLRSEIEQALYQRDLAGRAGALLDRAEQELARRQFAPAAECLATVRQMPLSDSRIQARLAKAEKQLNDARNGERLMQAAREHFRRENLTDALEAVTEALASDPASITGRQLLQEIRERIKWQQDQKFQLERRPEPQEQPAAPPAGGERLQRLHAGLDAMEFLVANRRFEEAAARLDMLALEFPDSLEVSALQTRVAAEIAKKREQARTGGPRPGRKDATAPLPKRHRAGALVWSAAALAVVAICGIVIWTNQRPEPAPPLTTLKPPAVESNSTPAPITTPAPVTTPPLPAVKAIGEGKAKEKPPDSPPAKRVAEVKNEPAGRGTPKISPTPEPVHELKPAPVTPPPAPVPAPPPHIQDIGPIPVAGGGIKDFTVTGAGFRDGMTVEFRLPGGSPSSVPVRELKETSFHLDLNLDRAGDYELVARSAAGESRFPFHVAAPPQPAAPSPTPPAAAPPPAPQNFLPNNCPVLAPAGQLATLNPDTDCELRQILTGNSSRALVHKYALHVNGRQHVTITVDASRGTQRFTPRLLLYDAQSNHLADGSSVGMAGAQILIDLNAGNYIILVTSAGRTGGQYVLEVK